MAVLSDEELAKWMGPGRRAGEEDSIREEPLTKAELWDAPVGQVIQAMWDSFRPVSADRGHAIRFDVPESIPLPESGTVVLRQRYSSCSGNQTIRWQLAWSPTGAWILAGGEAQARDETSFLREAPDLPDALFVREISTVQGRRMAGVLLALGSARAIERRGGPKEEPEDDEQRVIYLSSAHGEMVVCDAARPQPIYERRAKLTLLGYGEKAWKGPWNEDMALCVAVGAFVTAVEPFPPHRDRAGNGESARRASAAWILARERSNPGAVHPLHVVNAVLHAGELGWIELRATIADLVARHGARGDWEKRFEERAAEIRRLTDSLSARGEPGLTDSVIASDQPEREPEALENSTAEPEISLAARDDLNALSKLRIEQRQVAAEYELGDPNEAGRAAATLRRVLATAGERLDAWNDRGALRTLASKGSAWAYRRLRVLDPGEADAFLVAELKASPSLDGVRSIADELTKTAPALARGVLRDLSAERKALLDGAVAKDAGGAVMSDQELLRRVQDRTLEVEVRLSALRELVAAMDSAAPPDSSLNQALAKTLRREAASTDDMQGNLLYELANALARHGTTYWDSIAGALAKFDPTREEDAARLLMDLLPAIQAESGQNRASLSKLLRSRLSHVRPKRTEMVWIAWVCDAQELRGLIAEIGTFSPRDPEDVGVDGDMNSTARSRVHLARQVASLWDEPSAVTRLRLLAAFAFRNADRFAEREGPPARRLAAEWHRTAALLKPDEAQMVEATIRALDTAELKDYRHPDEKVNAVLRLLTALCANDASP